jgi:general secretion pathway protein G
MRWQLLFILACLSWAISGCQTETPRASTPALDKAEAVMASEKSQEAFSTASGLLSLIETFRDHVNRYPTTEEGLNALRVEPLESQGWRGPYLTRALPKDPWGNDFAYELTADNRPRVISYGKDGQPGGEGTLGDVVAEPLDR